MPLFTAKREAAAGAALKEKSSKKTITTIHTDKNENGEIAASLSLLATFDVWSIRKIRDIGAGTRFLVEVKAMLALWVRERGSDSFFFSPDALLF